MPEPTTEAELAELAIAVYVQELAADKRVLYVGEPQSRGPERLAKVAHSVELVSTRTRVRGTRRGGRVRSRRWPSPQDSARWDVVFVPDLSAAGLSEPGKFAEVADWLAPGGVFVVGSAGSGRPLTYEALFDSLQEVFESVRMIGQAPFRGFSLVDFAPPGELEVTFDGSLLGGAGERAERFVALCGEDDVVLDAYAVVQTPLPVESRREVPSAQTLATDGRVSELTERLRERQDALDAASVHAEDLEHELESVGSSLAAARKELATAQDLVLSLRAQARQHEASEASAEAASARATELAGRVRTLEAALDRATAERSRAGRSRAERSRVEPPAYDEEYARLETQLRQSGRELTQLRGELERRAVLVRDVVEELADSRGRAPYSEVVAPYSEVVAPYSEVVAPYSEVVAPGAGVIAPGAGVTAPAVPSPPTGAALDSQSTVHWSAEDLRDALQEQVADAVQRAVTAEAEKVELQYRLDEASGRLAIADQTREDELEELRRTEAALRGTVRGLNARLAEVTELFQLTQARVELGEDDRRSLLEANRGLQRDLAEAREELELQIVRQTSARELQAADPPRGTGVDASGEPSDSSNSSGSAEVTRLSEQLSEASAREAELRASLARAEAHRETRTGDQPRLENQLRQAEDAKRRLEQRLEGMQQGYQVRVAEIISELQETAGEAERALVQAGEFKTRICAMEREEAQLRGELRGCKLRLEDREAAVAELSARSESAVVDGSGREAVEDLREALARARVETELLRGRLEDSRASGSSSALAPRDERELSLEAQLRARDTMIARLQSALGAAVDHQRALRRDVDAARVELGDHRDQLASAQVDGANGAAESSRALDGLTVRLAETEREREHALDALEEARGILGDLVNDLPEAGEADAPTSGEVRSLREALSRLEAQASDREVLLRSLTAQIQQRDDRIRALETFDPSDDEDPDAVRASLLEMKERAARLAEELSNERRARRRLEDA